VLECGVSIKETVISLYGGASNSIYIGTDIPPLIQSIILGTLTSIISSTTSTNRLGIEVYLVTTSSVFVISTFH